MTRRVPWVDVAGRIAVVVCLALGSPVHAAQANTRSPLGINVTFFRDASSEWRCYIVVPNNGAYEGSYGRDGSQGERPAAAAACFPQSLEACSPDGRESRAKPTSPGSEGL